MSNAKTILLIDDDIDLQKLVKLTLKTRGYDVQTANNGLEGLAKLETIKPDLIILDMNMPKMGGLEFYHKICEGADRPKYPVMVLTARAHMEQLFKELNIDGFMTKPFEIEDLLREVEIIIGKKLNAGKSVSHSNTKGPRRVCIVENDAQTMSTIASIFLNAGYMVNPARNGVEGIERIMGSVPDVVLVSLGLLDIPGDQVILKLRLMAKTQDVKYILYSNEPPKKADIAQKMGDKEGVDRFVHFFSLQELLQVTNEVLSRSTALS